MHLTEAEDIRKKWQEYTEELYKKDVHDPDNHDGVVTDLEPDILECEVKWALGSITTNKASGGDGIPVELFQILNEGAMRLWAPVPQEVATADRRDHACLVGTGKGALGSIITNKASGGDRIPVELFQVLKDVL